MPLYDYHCFHCALTSELLSTFDARPACPRCGATDMERLLAAPAATGRSRRALDAARARAGQEGHLSNYAPSELKRR